MDAINLAGRKVGPGESPYIIAEIGSNHNGDMDLCRRLVDEARRAGADAVKFQSWSKDSLICRAEYGRNTSYTDKHRHFGTLAEMVEKYAFTPAQHRAIAAHCRQAGIAFLSSPFSPAEVDLLAELAVPAFKIASMDVNHFGLLEYVGAQGKPVILSTGMATLGEIERALDALRRGGTREIALLHCVSLYPPPPDSIHLRNIPMLREAFDVPVGFSDHTAGTGVGAAAVALGACLIEKHFTLDKTLPGWDHWLSAEPPELAALVRDAAMVHRALGSAQRVVGEAELAKRRQFRRRAVAGRALRRGAVLRAEDLAFKRPGTGIGPDEAMFAIGRRLKRDLAADEELEWADLE